jgi:ABC-2 type transport system permease protein
MAPWLKIVASLNPLTYAIEPIRYLYLQSDWSWSSSVLTAPWFSLNFAQVLTVLLLFDAIVLLLIQPLLKRRFL